MHSKYNYIDCTNCSMKPMSCEDYKKYYKRYIEDIRRRIHDSEDVYVQKHLKNYVQNPESR